MVLFQSIFVILCSTLGSLSKFNCNCSAMGKERNSNLDAFTAQTIFDFIFTIFSPYSTTKFDVSLKNQAISFQHSRTFPENIRLDEDVLKTSFVFVFRRRLDEDQYIRLGHASSRRLEDVLKTSSRRLAKMSSRHV